VGAAAGATKPWSLIGLVPVHSHLEEHRNVTAGMPSTAVNHTGRVQLEWVHRRCPLTGSVSANVPLRGIEPRTDARHFLSAAAGKGASSPPPQQQQLLHYALPDLSHFGLSLHNLSGSCSIMPLPELFTDLYSLIHRPEPRQQSDGASAAQLVATLEEDEDDEEEDGEDSAAMAVAVAASMGSGAGAGAGAGAGLTANKAAPWTHMESRLLDELGAPGSSAAAAATGSAASPPSISPTPVVTRNGAMVMRRYTATAQDDAVALEDPARCLVCGKVLAAGALYFLSVEAILCG
jgi:hypothetical protein